MLVNLENTWLLFFLFPIFSLLLWLFPSSEVLLTLFLSASHMCAFPFVSLGSSSSHCTLNAETPRFSFLEHCYYYSVLHLPWLLRLPVLHTGSSRHSSNVCLLTLLPRCSAGWSPAAPFSVMTLGLPLAISPCSTSLFSLDDAWILFLVLF